jgi:AcrR family transcriptional regulator
MKKADRTREKLLTHARRLMWARGYGAVSLREVAQAAGVDVALVSRYFGGKYGLFEATLHDAFPTELLAGVTPDTLVDRMVTLFVEAPRDGEDPSAIRMILMNSHDDEVGDLVRATQDTHWAKPLSDLLDSPQNAALLAAVLFGLSVAEKSLHLKGIAPVGSPAYAAQLRHLMQAALDFKG